MREKLIILASFLLVVTAVVGLSMLRGEPDKPAASPAPKISAAGAFRGISLQLHNSSPDIPYQKYIDEIARAGANTLCLVVSAWQENCSSTSIFIDLRKTPSDRRVGELIAHARKLGLRVVFMPIVLLENQRTGEWRGMIKPEKDNWDDWWEDYTNYVLHYAGLAQAGGVDVFMVGSELISTETQDKRWRALIAKVRKAFKGRLSYSANWDHYTVVKWWDDLDLIGMTTYYDLTGGKKPTVERLVQAWKPIRDKILKWQAKTGRPILFTEVGWPNQETCAQFPWDYYRSKKPDPTAQANCFQAFFQTWADQDAVDGFLVWEWRNYPAQKTGPKDTPYVPCGKPAMNVIQKYLTRPAAKGRTDAAGATRPTTRPTTMPATK